MIYRLSLKYLLIIPLGILLLGLLLSIPYLILFSLLMATFVFLKVRFTQLVLLDDRIQYSEGIVFKSKKEIFYKQINNIEHRSNPIQGLLQAGTVIIYTGNDIPLILESIENINEFKSKITINNT